jgi:tetratricopeptide (TPR) repeat protein
LNPSSDAARLGGWIVRRASVLTDPQCFHRRWLSAVIATVTMLLLALIGPVAAQAQPSDALAEAQALYEQGQLSQALARVEAALAEGNTDSAAALRFLQGLIASEQGRPDDAIEIFTALTVSHPDLAAPYNNLAVLYSQAGEVDKALDALRAAVDARPDYAVGHENLGDLYVKLAARSYSRSLAEDDENRSARLKFSAVGEFIAQSADLFGSAPAAPEAEPAAADPASADLTDAERARIEREVTDALTLWRLAWSGQNADAYFAAYSADFVPRGSPRAEWLQRKRELINAPENIDVIVEDVRVDVLAADRARVRFLQRYRSDRYEDEGTKILEFRRIGRRWQIEREANVSRRSAARVLPVDQRVGTDERTEPATVDQSLIAAALAPRLVPPPRQPQAAPALTAELTRPEGRAESDALFQPDPEARSEAPPPQPAPDAPLSPSDKLSPPERDLLLAMDHLRRGDHDAALQASRTLLQQRPDFELARALAADVEAAGHDEPTRLDWSPTAPAAAHPRWEDDPLAALQAEIAQRWAHRDFDADGRIPDVLVHVAPEVRHVIVVETTTSRLYLFRKPARGAGADGGLLRVDRPRRRRQAGGRGSAHAAGRVFHAEPDGRWHARRPLRRPRVPAELPEQMGSPPAAHRPRHLAARRAARHLHAPAARQRGLRGAVQRRHPPAGQNAEPALHAGRDHRAGDVGGARGADGAGLGAARACAGVARDAAGQRRR